MADSGRQYRPRLRDESIRLRDAVGYGIGDVFGGGQLTLVSTYLVLFWTRFCAMSISSAQSAYGMGAIISGLAALMFGILDDNLYRFKVGRRLGRRHLFLMLVPPLILMGLFMWIPGLPFALYFVLYVLWVIVAQLFASAYNSLPGEMAPDFENRTKLSTVRLLISGASGTVILLVAGVVLSVFGEHRPRGYMLIAFGSTICFALAVAVCAVSTWEMTPQEAGFGAYENGSAQSRGRVSREAKDSKSSAKNSGKGGASRWRAWRRSVVRGASRSFRLWRHRAVVMFRQYGSTLGLRVFRIHLLLYLLLNIATDVFGQLFVFFVIYDWHRSAAFASLLLGMNIVSVLLTPLFGVAVTKVNPKRIYRISFVGCLIAVAWLSVCWALSAWSSQVWWTVLAVGGVLFFMCAKGLAVYLPWALFPFIADVDQVVSGRYRSATYSGMQSFLRQISSGLTSIALGAVLGFVGFDSSLSVQAPLARNVLGGLIVGSYCVVIALCWVIVSGFDLDRRTDAIALAETARRAAGGDPRDVDPSVRITLEHLTGRVYGR